MKRLCAVALLIIAASITVLGQTVKSDYNNITILETLEAAGNFQTLLNALRTTGLINTLKGPGPFTLFAPNDAAFAKLGPVTLDALLKNPAKLKALLLYHVASGKLSVKDLQGRTDKSLTMMVDGKAWFECNERPTGDQTKVQLLCNDNPAQKKTTDVKLQCNETGKHTLVLNKSANVIMADLSTANGMIHVIDAVLMPGNQ
jgi:uncharacterized surface protein with fasciclin (FAS1) repeats